MHKNPDTHSLMKNKGTTRMTFKRKNHHICLNLHMNNTVFKRAKISLAQDYISRWALSVASPGCSSHAINVEQTLSQKVGEVRKQKNVGTAQSALQSRKE